MSDLALEITERGGIDVEYGESQNTLLLTEADLAEAEREALLAPFVRARGVETGWLDATQLREAFPSLSPIWCRHPDAHANGRVHSSGGARRPVS